MIDIAHEIESTQREVGEDRTADGATVRTVRLQRDLDAPIDDVWDAFTSPERIGRWFLPISGDYRLGGRYQFEGNAGGEILECERPRRLRLSERAKRCCERTCPKRDNQLATIVHTPSRQTTRLYYAKSLMRRRIGKFYCRVSAECRSIF